MYINNDNQYHIPRDPSTFLGSVWGIMYYELEGQVLSQAAFGSIRYWIPVPRIITQYVRASLFIVSNSMSNLLIVDKTNIILDILGCGSKSGCLSIWPRHTQKKRCSTVRCNGVSGSQAAHTWSVMSVLWGKSGDR